MAYTPQGNVLQQILEELKRHEGFSETPYRDSEGNDTIGYGTKLPLTAEQARSIGAQSNTPQSITELDADALMLSRLNDIMADIANRVERSYGIDMSALPENIQIALGNMGYQNGPSNLLEFDRMWQAIANGNYEIAAGEALDSDYGRKFRNRANEVALRMQNNVQDVQQPGIPRPGQGQPTVQGVTFGAAVPTQPRAQTNTTNYEQPHGPIPQQHQQVQDPFRVFRPGFPVELPRQIRAGGASRADPGQQIRPDAPNQSPVPTETATGTAPQEPVQRPAGRGWQPPTNKEPPQQGWKPPTDKQPVPYQPTGTGNTPEPSSQIGTQPAKTDQVSAPTDEKYPGQDKFLEAMYAGIAGYLNSRGRRKEQQEQRKRMAYKPVKSKKLRKSRGLG